MFIPTAVVEAAGGVGAILFDSTLGADTTTIDTGAGGIAAGYNVIEVFILSRTSEVIDVALINVTVNNDGSAIYDRQILQGANVTAAAGITVAGTSWQISTAGDSQQAGACGVARLTIPGYTQTTFHKAAEFNSGTNDDTAANNRAVFGALRWRSTAAITRMAVAAASGNLRAGSRLLIYGR